MTLYEINDQIMAVLGRMAEETDENGEFEDFLVDELEALQMARDEKLEAIGCYIKNLDAECEALKAEIKNLKDRLDKKIAKSERLEEYVKHDLLFHGDTKKEFTRVVFSFRKSTLVSITSLDDVPEEYGTVKSEFVVDKKKISAAIKSGETVPGAELVEKQNLQIK